jgi:predicted acetyltransferase
VKPNKELKTEYLAMIAEWNHSGEKKVPWVLDEESDEFEAMLSRWEDYSRGIGIKEGFVPHSTYWLVRNDNKVLGAVNIRHELNDCLRNRGGHIGYGIKPSERRKGYAKEMLRLALEIARKLNITRALITCDKENIASARTIMGNGGVFDSESVEDGVVFQRYWLV